MWFGGTSAAVLRHTDTRILARVPEGAATGAVSVNGVTAPEEFTVLPPGSPVVFYIRPTTVSAGELVLVFGLRLFEPRVEIGGIAATRTRGSAHVLAFDVPATVPPGVHTVTITNRTGLSTGACSPEITVVAEGSAAITEFDPDGQAPGRRLTILGAHLGLGPTRVTWTLGQNPALVERGSRTATTAS